MATAAQIFKDNMIERQRAQAELARVGRLTTMGELVASIAHEINQPLAAILANGEAGLRWLNRNEPDLDEVRDAVSRITQDGRRAGKMIENLRALAKKSEPQAVRFDINSAIQEVLLLTRSELMQHDVVLHTHLSAADRMVLGDAADRIFESFFTTKPNGMGMGLSICRSIIEAHGERFWASHNTPHGAIFQFTLPAGSEPPAPNKTTFSS
jgi:C4-dicarboxylate-specific signal transduction histidine kinase